MCDVLEQGAEKVWGSVYSGFWGRIWELQRFNQKGSGFGIVGFSLVGMLLCINLVGFVHPGLNSGSSHL